MHKLISRSSFHLKGDGWYVTDYAKKPSGADKSAAATDTAAGKTDTKTTDAAAPSGAASRSDE